MNHVRKRRVFERKLWSLGRRVGVCQVARGVWICGIWWSTCGLGIIIGYLWLLLFFFYLLFFFICFFCYGVNSNEKQLSMQLKVFVFILLYFLFRTITNQVSCGKLWEFVVGRCVRIVWMEIESRWSAWVILQVAQFV